MHEQCFMKNQKQLLLPFKLERVWVLPSVAVALEPV